MVKTYGEVTGIHRKIDELSSTMQRQVRSVGKDVSYMKGVLDATLPSLARTTEVEAMIAGHKESCRKSIMPKSEKNGVDVKKGAKIGAAIGVLASAVYGLVEAIKALIAAMG